MKLVFPGGEHPQVLLGHGLNRVGSDPDANIVLDRPGVMPQHCQLHVTAHGVMLDVPQGAEVCVNDRQVDGLIALRAGDTVAFDNVRARLASMEAVTAIGQMMGVAGATLPSANDDPGVTAVRQVLPKYVLRGVAGTVAGRNLPLLGVTTIGRAAECVLRLDAPGLSRVHARLTPTDAGVQVEDLGSTNGSFINGQRVLRGVAKAGDEIGFDSLRFRLVASASAQAAPAPASAAPAMPSVQARSGSAWPRIARIALIAGGVAVVVLTASAVITQLR